MSRLVIQTAYAASWTHSPNLYVRTQISRTADYARDIVRNWGQLTDGYIAIVNKSGFENDYGFMGGSLVLNPQGETLVDASSAVGIVYADLPLDADGRLRSGP